MASVCSKARDGPRQQAMSQYDGIHVVCTSVVVKTAAVTRPRTRPRTRSALSRRRPIPRLANETKQIRIAVNRTGVQRCKLPQCKLLTADSSSIVHNLNTCIRLYQHSQFSRGDDIFAIIKLMLGLNIWRSELLFMEYNTIELICTEIHRTNA